LIFSGTLICVGHHFEVREGTRGATASRHEHGIGAGGKKVHYQYIILEKGSGFSQRYRGLQPTAPEKGAISPAIKAHSLGRVAMMRRFTPDRGIVMEHLKYRRSKQRS